MRTLLTGAGVLGRKLAAALAQTHDVLATDTVAGPGVQVVADLQDPAAVARLVVGRDAIIHTEPLVAHDAGDALDTAARGTYGLLLAAVDAGVERFVLLSTLRLFDRYPTGLAVESFRPRPTTSPRDLAPYLAEVVAREVTRVSPLTTVCLRLGNVVSANPAEPAVTPRSVHVEDVVQAIDRALHYRPAAPWPGNSYEVYHAVAAGQGSRYPLGAAGRDPFGYTPRHELTYQDAEDPSPQPAVSTTDRDASLASPPRRIVVYGAGGPLGAATAEILSTDRVLRLTDIHSLSEIQVAGKPQSPGAPIARPYGPPHDEARVDVGDEAQVVAAAEGMDAILNCSVIRTDPVGAFRVNLVGAHNVCVAALANGIRRVVHTGPQQVTAYARGLQGYVHDFGVVDDVPARPGTNLYLLTKHLGQEVCRIFAEEHGLEIPALLFSSFVNPDYPPERPHEVYPMSVSWSDAARAIRRALDVPFPPHLETMHVLADLPHGKFTNDKVKRLLDWEPRDGLDLQLGYDSRA